ncbi:MAG TPA: prolyl oligopeptidase family serine peptidase [Candidatus Methylomirabilis sp.]|nr:prolyl oligopeptidase family serine peptidase [Candidatus Methylomirabilis sp.]
MSSTPRIVASRLAISAAVGIIALAVSAAQAQTNLKYQLPPKTIVDIVDAKPTPGVKLSPPAAGEKRWLLIEHFAGLPTIAELAQPELRLAGLRFNPKTDGPSRGRYDTSLELQALPSGKPIAVSGLPANAEIRFAEWSPDGRKVSFVNISNEQENPGLSLWIVDVATAQAKQIPRVALNGIFARSGFGGADVDAPCEWLSDSNALICKTVPSNRGSAPVRSEVPTGPVIQQNLGRVTPAPTFEDLLKNPEDVQFFDYYATAQLALVNLDGTSKPLGDPGVIESAIPSPNGEYVLLTERHHPYSFLRPYESFPERVSVVAIKAGKSIQLADKPLEDNISIVRDAVPPGPRDYAWRSDVPASVFWVEAQDGGDPRKNSAVRDALFLLDAPFDGTPRKLADLPLRFRSIDWGTNQLALIEERRWKDRKRILLAVSPSAPSAPATLFEGSFEDRYKDPGSPLEEPNPAGKRVLVTTHDAHGVYFRGQGASPEGDKPFLSVVDASTGESKRLWQSAPPNFEILEAVLDSRASEILIRRESQEKNPNYFIEKLGSSSAEQVTFFPSPYGDTPLPKKQVLHYQRADGVELSANLYVPPGYKPSDGPLPTLMEAYPTEYKTRAAAAEVTGSPYQFVVLSWGSPVPFVTQGYAVLESASIPIVGEGSAEPNDTYVDQLVASAKAAIDEGARLGVVDRNRVGVMGHSYGAFMTANLLAHSSLFKAGIARSGAYNRTLTPYGFQNEERTYWQAPEVYYKMSPFSFADKVKTPILLIHGEADNNNGTFPIQSERFYSALKGQGATVRFVLLPLESHGYQGRESVLHMFWEMNNWLNTYVKNPPASTTASATAGAATSKP